MAMDKIEFEFPDEDGEDGVEIEVEAGTTTELEPEVKDKPKRTPKVEDEDDIELEIVDDTPPEDRGKKKSDPPDEVTDEELEAYSEKVRKRIQHFSKGYHDERREKEAALREKQEMEAYTRKIIEENKKLKGSYSQIQKLSLDQAKAALTAEHERVKAKLRAAYEAGNTDEVIEAQEQLTTVKMRLDRVNNFKLPSEEVDTRPQQRPQAQAPKPDERALKWADRNEWFGQDDEMTSFAHGVHQKLARSGVKPGSDEYYEKLDSRMREVFPEQFDDVDTSTQGEDEKPRKRQKSVVAPATRSSSPKKIRLTETQVKLAKRLGVPLADYAKQVAEDMRNANG